ncbi:MAG: hypothetical protein KJO17_12955 [Acidimicrobiia bacterium]|nr:hypothetical protein [Acidimicrobiia bacterium]NNL71633.1 hypothetical protein [Acidimicrobiia bacterium]
MQSQLTSTARQSRRVGTVDLWPVGRIVALIGAAALAVAIALAAGIGTAPQQNAISADQLRWEAIAQGYAGPSVRAIDASAARLAGLAIHHSALTPAQQAAADRWGGLAARSDNG